MDDRDDAAGARDRAGDGEEQRHVDRENGRAVSAAQVSVTNEQVLLVVPAKPEMWSIVRMTASALAARLDFTVDEVEDLRLAVTELCTSCSGGATSVAQCECRFELSSEGVELRLTVYPAIDRAEPDNELRLMSTLDLSRQILQATVDEYSIGEVVEGQRTGYLRKLRTSADRP